MVEKTSTLPLRDPRFVGQKAALAELRQKLGFPQVQAVALVGLGGAGYLFPHLTLIQQSPFFSE